jgi:hypothetical protein
VRPLLGLAASMEQERNHVMPPPKAQDPEALDLDPLPAEEREPVTLKQFEALEADARFAHVLHGGTAHTGEGRPAAEPLAAEEEDFLGIPGLLTAEQTASLLARRDDELRLRIAQRAHHDDTGELPIVEDHPDEDDAGRSWRDAAELRREVNRLVARVAAKTSRPHGVVHTELRKAVPGPPSASASVDVLRARRERLRTML